MQAFRKHGILTVEQQVSDSKPLHELINTTKILLCNLRPLSRSEAQNAHPLQGTVHNITLHNMVSINLTSVQQA